MPKLEKTGTFRAKVKSWNDKPSLNGTPRIAVEFEVTEGSETGAHIWSDHWMTEKCQERTAETMLVCGWTGVDFDNLPGLGSVPVEIVVKEDSYNGITSPRVKFVNKPGSRGGPTGPRAASGFAERMAALALGIKAKSGAAAPPAEDFGTRDDESSLPF